MANSFADFEVEHMFQKIGKKKWRLTDGG